MTGLSWLAVVFLNGVPVPPEAVEGLDLVGVDVRMEGDDVWITAPDWRVDHGRVLRPGEPTAAEAAVPPVWYLLMEDVGSKQMAIQVTLNGQPVQTLRSGEGNRLVPLGSVLRPGRNDVEVVIDGATGEGRMAVLVAPGRTVNGVVRIDGEPTRYLVSARQLGTVTFTVDQPMPAPY